MPAEHEENLDSVISDLVDSDDEDTNGKSAQASPFEGIDVPESPASGKTVALTSRAAKQVQKIIAEEDIESGLYLRVAVEGGGCSGLSYKLGLDYKKDEDKLIESQGIEIIVDPRHMMYLEGIEIDYPDGLDARGFTFDNPNASESCGCGSSFAI
ncbi:MAG: iron-sulfur cluster assembly accessory protein [Balneolaceae bacterium]|nr:iron-sulfur cluster assembly accessory protein [Balneolaceae bacterium]